MPKETIIFDNYDVSEIYEEAKANLIDRHLEDHPDDKDFVPQEQKIWEECDEIMSFAYEEAMSKLEDAFSDVDALLIYGTVERWNEMLAVSAVYKNFKDLFYAATQDCNYFKISDIGGHLYLTCSHHDGTNRFEVKTITKAGYNYYSNWEDGFRNSSRFRVMESLRKNYTRLPRVAKED